MTEAIQSTQELCEAIVGAQSDMVLLVDEQDCIVFCNNAAASLFRGEPSEMVGTSVECLLASLPISQDQLDRPTWWHLRSGIQANEAVNVTELHTPSGEQKLFETLPIKQVTERYRMLTLRDVSTLRLESMRTTKANLVQRVAARFITRCEAKRFNQRVGEVLSMVSEVMGFDEARLIRIRQFDGARTSTTPAEWPVLGDEGDLSLNRIDLLRYPDSFARLERGSFLFTPGQCDFDVGLREDLEDAGIAAFIAIPVVVDGRIENVLMFAYNGRAHEWQYDEHAVLADLARSIAFSIERMQRDEQLNTERDRAREALARAEAASQSRGAFFANVSHELRTPLTAILGYSELMNRESLEPEKRLQMAHRIRRSAYFLLNLINDTLDLSKIENHKMEMRPEEVDLLELLKDVTSSLTWIAESKNTQLLLERSEGMPRRILIDPTRLRQVLTNLVSNALKFTHEGTVRLVATADFDARIGRTILDLAVIDTGIGIREDRLGDLFAQYTQVHSTSEYGGTGLGLAITKHLTSLMQGSLNVDSIFGEGSTFRVRMPVDVIGLETSQKEPDVDTATIEDVGSARILVADDNEDNRKIFDLVLRDVGHDVHLVENGQDAVARVRAGFEDGHPFDLVLMDVNMPVMDGLAATRVLRAEDVRIPIVALTALSMESDRDKCFAAGCDDFISKPTLPRTLIKKVACYVGEARNCGSVARTGGGATASGSVQDETATSEVACSEEAAVLESSFDGMPEYEELLHAYRSALPDQFAEIVAAVGAGDESKVKGLMHKMKGSAGCYGFQAISDIAKGCENALRRGEGLDTLDTAMGRLGKMIGTITGDRK